MVTLDYILDVYGFKPYPSWSPSGPSYHVRPEQDSAFQEALALHPEVRTIMVIGLNAGHSAEAFLTACPQFDKCVAFDIKKWPYTEAAIASLAQESDSSRLGAAWKFPMPLAAGASA